MTFATLRLTSQLPALYTSHLTMLARSVTIPVRATATRANARKAQNRQIALPAHVHRDAFPRLPAVAKSSSLSSSPSSRSQRSVVARGVPVLSSLPLVGWAFSTPVMTIIYVFVAIRMWLGYDRTTFGTGVPKIAMVGLWPVLSILSESFRQNLKRSM